MAKGKGIGYEVSNVSTSTTITTTAGKLYGLWLISKTTGAVQVVALDAKATAAGTVIFGYSITGGTNNQDGQFCSGIACGTGLHIQALSCTSGSDQIIVYYGGI